MTHKTWFLPPDFSLLPDGELALGTVDHEVQSFNGHFRPECLQAITELAKVMKHINGERFGRRPVYIISGLRVARDSFTVTDEVGSTVSISLAVSGAAPAPLEAAANNLGSGERKRTDGYGTAPGIVFAYRLHVIRDKESGDVDSELFSHQTAFLTGEGDDDEGQEELEVAEVTAEIVNQDLEVEPDFDEYAIGSDSYFMFRRKV